MMSWRSTPRSKIRVGGITIPSWKIVAAEGTMLEASIAPVSS